MLAMPKTSACTRRQFLRSSLLGAAMACVASAPVFGKWIAAAQATTMDLLHDTFNGLLAFVVPGADAYSVAQGISTAGPGGLDVGGLDALIATLDETTPFVPQFSATVAAVLNELALAVDRSASGPFVSPFSRLSFGEKVVVFEVMDATDSLKPLAGVLLPFVAFFCYSEAGAFDPVTRSLAGHPLAWQLSNYGGVADGRDEFLGYFRQGATHA
jgi:hypothetical protein